MYGKINVNKCMKRENLVESKSKRIDARKRASILVIAIQLIPTLPTEKSSSYFHVSFRESQSAPAFPPPGSSKKGERSGTFISANGSRGWNRFRSAQGCCWTDLAQAGACYSPIAGHETSRLSLEPSCRRQVGTSCSCRRFPDSFPRY